MTNVYKTTKQACEANKMRSMNTRAYFRLKVKERKKRCMYQVECFKCEISALQVCMMDHHFISVCPNRPNVSSRISLQWKWFMAALIFITASSTELPSVDLLTIDLIPHEYVHNLWMKARNNAMALNCHTEKGRGSCSIKLFLCIFHFISL